MKFDTVKIVIIFQTAKRRKENEPNKQQILYNN